MFLIQTPFGHYAIIMFVTEQVLLVLYKKEKKHQKGLG